MFCCLSSPNLHAIAATRFTSTYVINSTPQDFFAIVNYLFFFNVYLFLRERWSMRRGGAERDGDTELEAGSKLRAVSTEPNVVLELTN